MFFLTLAASLIFFVQFLDSRTIYNPLAKYSHNSAFEQVYSPNAQEIVFETQTLLMWGSLTKLSDIEGVLTKTALVSSRMFPNDIDCPKNDSFCGQRLAYLSRKTLVPLVLVDKVDHLLSKKCIRPFTEIPLQVKMSNLNAKRKAGDVKGYEENNFKLHWPFFLEGANKLFFETKPDSTNSTLSREERALGLFAVFGANTVVSAIFSYFNYEVSSALTNELSLKVEEYNKETVKQFSILSEGLSIIANLVNLNAIIDFRGQALEVTSDILKDLMGTLNFASGGPVDTATRHDMNRIVDDGLIEYSGQLEESQLNKYREVVSDHQSAHISIKYPDSGSRHCASAVMETKVVTFVPVITPNNYFIKVKDYTYKSTSVDHVDSTYLENPHSVLTSIAGRHKLVTRFFEIKEGTKLIFEDNKEGSPVTDKFVILFSQSTSENGSFVCQGANEEKPTSWIQQLHNDTLLTLPLLCSMKINNLVWIRRVTIETINMKKSSTSSYLARDNEVVSTAGGVIVGDPGYVKRKLEENKKAIEEEFDDHQEVSKKWISSFFTTPFSIGKIAISCAGLVVLLLPSFGLIVMIVKKSFPAGPRTLSLYNPVLPLANSPV